MQYINQPVDPMDDSGPSAEEKRQAIRQALMDKYRDATDDTSALDDATKDAKYSNTVANIGSGLESIARSVGRTDAARKVDSEFYQGLASQAQQNLKNTQAAHQAKTQAALQGIEVNRGLEGDQRNDVKAAQDTTKFNQETEQYQQSQDKYKAEHDPNSTESKLAQQLNERLGGTPNPNLTAEQFKMASPVAMAMYEGEFKKRKLNIEQQEADIKGREADIKARQASVREMPGEKAADDQFGKDYVEWRNGGSTQADKAIQRLHDAKSMLSDSIASGDTISGNVQGRLPEVLQNEKSRNIKAIIDESGLSALKSITGGRVSTAEMKVILASWYDPALSPDQNLKKLDANLSQLERQRDAKNGLAAYYEKNRTISGYGNQSPASTHQVSSDKTPVKREYSPSRNQTRVTYSDGSTEIVDGK